VPERALADTSRWLARPQRWDHNGGEGEFSDKVLARIQFAAALVDAIDATLVKEPQALAQAAEVIVRDQHAGGYWKVDAEGTIGSPATHGSALATYWARRTLQRADAKKYRAAIARADQWFRNFPVKSVLDAAAVLLALEGAEDAVAVSQRQRCLALIRKGQAKDGGWGPFVSSPPEPFDTAVVLLALSRLPAERNNQAMIQRGRGYLLALQQKNGSWRETTRPPGAESYAQRLSTSGWATLALLATARK
jgi:hypothetical protein